MLKIKNGVFVHFPKTGGTFIRELARTAISEKVEKVTPPHLYDIPKDLNYDFSFICVRNPIDWYISVWRYLTDFHGNGGEWGSEWNPMVDLSNVFDTNFNIFIQKVIREYPSHYTKTFKLYAGDDLDKIDFVLKTETLTFDFVYLLTRKGLKFDKGAILNSPKHGKRNHEPLFHKKYGLDIIEMDREILEKYYL